MTKNPCEKNADYRILTDLAKRYRDVASLPIMKTRRDAWRRHNSLVPTRPLIYTRAFAWCEMPESALYCTDPLFRHFENHFRHALYWHSLDDDSIFEPWVVLSATCVCPPQGLWGMSMERIESPDSRGAWGMRPPIKSPDDAAKMVVPRHEIDEIATAANLARIREAIGDILPVVVDRAPLYRVWAGDISTCLAQLRGIDQLMLDMMERPEWLHEVLAFMRDGILKTHAEAEEAGDWRLCAHQNQAMPYAEELADPSPDEKPVNRKDLWGYLAAQELTLTGPAQFEEFMLDYQLPILGKFGLAAYGCCEDLTLKIECLKRISNLRRIAVAPRADAVKCAEKIGDQYVLSYRPSPSDMVGYGFDPQRIRAIMRHDLEACRANGCHVDITLKDVETVQSDPRRVREWVKITRELIDEIWEGEEIEF